MKTVGDILNLLFGCRHKQLSRVFTIHRRTYRVCCNCGVELDYSLERMSVSPVAPDRQKRQAITQTW